MTAVGRHKTDNILHGTESCYRTGCRLPACIEAASRGNEGRKHATLIEQGQTHERGIERSPTGNYTPRTRLGILAPHSERMRIKLLFSRLRLDQIAFEDSEGEVAE